MKSKFKVGDHVKVVHNNNQLDSYITNRLAKINWRFRIVSIDYVNFGCITYTADKIHSDIGLSCAWFFEHEIEKIIVDDNIVCRNKK